jgi:hypothetical protein
VNITKRQRRRKQQLALTYFFMKGKKTGYILVSWKSMRFPHAMGEEGRTCGFTLPSYH